MKSQAIRDAEYDVDRLFCWADNENHPSTYLIFLVLTGHLEADFIRPLGHLEASLLEAIARDGLKRQAAWTEGLAVGSAEFVKRFKPHMQSRRETQIERSGQDLWVLKETNTPYSLESGPKSGCNGGFAQ